MQIANFDATGIEPKQSTGAHPTGTFPFVIGNTYGQENKAKDGGMLCVQFTTQAGTIINYYNLFNKSEKAVEIAKKELSALCHAVGVFKLGFEGLPMDQWARELRNARGVVEIGPQVGNEAFMEVKKVFDTLGNEPGKGPTPAPQPAAQGWGQQPAQTAPQQAPAAQQGGWNANPPANPAPANTGWQPGPNTNVAPSGGGQVAPPPWAK